MRSCTLGQRNVGTLFVALYLFGMIACADGERGSNAVRDTGALVPELTLHAPDGLAALEGSGATASEPALSRPAWTPDWDPNTDVTFRWVEVCEEPTATPVHHWTLDDPGSGPLVDLGTGDAEGERVGATITAGLVAGAVAFDGESFVDVPDGLAFDGQSAGTVSLWFRRADTGVRQVLVARMPASSGYRGWMLYLNDNRRLEFMLRHSTTGSNHVAVSTPYGFWDTQWHHAAVIMRPDVNIGWLTAAEIELYVDGVLVDDAIVVRDALSGTPEGIVPLTMGGRPYNVTYRRGTSSA